jgi:hypothetical protein
MDLPWLEGPDPRLVWGLVPRLLGVIYLIALGALIPQARAIVGERGIGPVRQRLARMAEDYPGLRRFLEMPTLLWLSPSDTMIRALPIVGSLGAAWAIYGGPYSHLGLVVAWVCLLSLDVCSLMFPWDCMLLEAGFLALFLPTGEALPSLYATELPLPVVSFMWRFLVIRLMLGFAKLKFIGTKRGDSLYLKGFMTWMPMPSPLGWWMHHAPAWFLRAALVFMFVAEVVCPILGFFQGDLRLVGALGLMGLMVGIQLTGNWGYFNVAYLLACIGLFDTQSSLFDTTSAMLVAQPVTHVVMAVLFVGSVLYFPLNSWCSQTWIHWPFDDITWNRRWLGWLLAFYRLLAPLRLVNAYGVFPPHSSPPVKMVPIIEGSRDGRTWEAYTYKFMPTHEDSPPPLVSPFHPRVDQAIIYIGAGMTDADLLSSIMGTGRPYGLSSYSLYSWPHRLLQRLLEGEPSVLKLFATNPFDGEPPRWIRLSTYAFTPRSPAERAQTGKWWRRRYVGPLFAPTELDPRAFIDSLPQPELFHPDDVYRKRRAPTLKAMTEAFSQSGDAHGSVLVGSDLDASTRDRFWSEVVPFLAAERGQWESLPERVKAFRARYPQAERVSFERLMERYAILLRTRLDPHFYRDAKPKIELRSNFRFSMLLHELIVDGREAFEAVLAQPELAAARATACTDASLLYTLALFRHDMIMYHAYCFRQMSSVTDDPGWPIPGIMEMKAFLSAQVPPGVQWLPSCERTPKGEWAVEGFEEPGLAE